MKLLWAGAAGGLLASMLSYVLLRGSLAEANILELLPIVLLAASVWTLGGCLLALTAASILLIRKKMRKNQPLHSLEPGGMQSELEQLIVREGFAAQLRSRPAVRKASSGDEKATSTSTRVLFVTSNGGGLGHVNRTLAVARAWKGEARFFTLSKGYPLISEAGYEGVHLPSHEYAEVSRDQWGRIFTAALWEELIEHRPDLIVFDGAAIYPELSATSRVSGVPLVWLRRGLWKKEVRLRSRQYNFPRSVCDFLIEPGDLALGTTGNIAFPSDAEPWKFSVPAIVNHDAELDLTREQALKELQLDPGDRHVLIQLGAGNINNITDAEIVASEAVRQLGPAWTPVIARSPIAGVSKKGIGPVIERFPLSRYFKAFEFCIISGGYNGIQEVISLGVPSVCVPNLYTLTDDQATRASEAAEKNLMKEARTSSDIRQAVNDLGDFEHRQRILDSLSRVPKPQGAEEVVRILHSIAKENWEVVPLAF